MNKSILETISSLEKRLDYHSYCVESETRYSIDSLIETLTLALLNKASECPDVTLPFRDVIDTLHQLNSVLLYEDKDEIDRDFFGTGVQFPISFDISLISKELLSCHYKFKAQGISSERLVSYAWLLSEAWHLTLCQDVVNLWGLLVGVIKKTDDDTYTSLIECVPIEKRNSDTDMFKRCP